jgi:hypothetical protein
MVSDPAGKFLYLLGEDGAQKVYTIDIGAYAIRYWGIERSRRALVTPPGIRYRPHGQVLLRNSKRPRHCFGLCDQRRQLSLDCGPWLALRRDSFPISGPIWGIYRVAVDPTDKFT